jgi:hypothetical protein
MQSPQINLTPIIPPRPTQPPETRQGPPPPLEPVNLSLKKLCISILKGLCFCFPSKTAAVAVVNAPANQIILAKFDKVTSSRSRFLSKHCAESLHDFKSALETGDMGVAGAELGKMSVEDGRNKQLYFKVLREARRCCSEEDYALFKDNFTRSAIDTFTGKVPFESDYPSLKQLLRDNKPKYQFMGAMEKAGLFTVSDMRLLLYDNSIVMPLSADTEVELVPKKIYDLIFCRSVRLKPYAKVVLCENKFIHEMNVDEDMDSIKRNSLSHNLVEALATAGDYANANKEPDKTTVAFILQSNNLYAQELLKNMQNTVILARGTSAEEEAILAKENPYHMPEGLSREEVIIDLRTPAGRKNLISKIVSMKDRESFPAILYEIGLAVRYNHPTITYQTVGPVLKALWDADLKLSYKSSDVQELLSTAKDFYRLPEVTLLDEKGEMVWENPIEYVDKGDKSVPEKRGGLDQTFLDKLAFLTSGQQSESSLRVPPSSETDTVKQAFFTSLGVEGGAYPHNSKIKQVMQCMSQAMAEGTILSAVSPLLGALEDGLISFVPLSKGRSMKVQIFEDKAIITAAQTLFDPTNATSLQIEVQANITFTFSTGKAKSSAHVVKMKTTERMDPDYKKNVKLLQKACNEALNPWDVITAPLVNQLMAKIAQKPHVDREKYERLSKNLEASTQNNDIAGIAKALGTLIASAEDGSKVYLDMLKAIKHTLSKDEFKVFKEKFLEAFGNHFRQKGLASKQTEVFKLRFLRDLIVHKVMHADDLKRFSLLPPQSTRNW